MDQASPPISSQSTPRMRAAAFSVHIFTALGAGVALIAMLEAVREHWTGMFAWLGVALIIDAVDGPIARRLDVVRLQPNWSGDILDLVVDFLTYVFVPAYAITASGLLLPLAAPLLSSVAVAILIALTFMPIHVVHPFRVIRLRWLTLWLLGAWAVLAVMTLVYDFNVGPSITFGLCAIAAYIIGSDAVIRLIKSSKA